MCPCCKQQTAKDQMSLVWFAACSLNRKPLSFPPCSKAAADPNYFVILRVGQLKLKRSVLVFHKLWAIPSLDA